MTIPARHSVAVIIMMLVSVVILLWFVSSMPDVVNATRERYPVIPDGQRLKVYCSTEKVKVMVMQGTGFASIECVKND